MTNIKHVVSLVVLGLSGSACYQGMEGGDLIDEVAQMRDTEWNDIKWNDIKWNDIKWNDIKWNDIKWNGLRFNDIKWNGIKFNDIKWNDIKWNSSRLDGSAIVVSKKIKGKLVEHRGEELIGMDLEISVDVIDGQGVKSVADFILRADDIYTDDVFEDVHYYDFVISRAGTNDWQPLCGDGGPVIPIRNYWDENTGKRIDDKDVVTFACTNGVLAHCAQWGYRPWATAKQCSDWENGKKNCKKVSLADYHQACTRMARADYCGDGKPWTVPGTPIDIYDHLSPQLESKETNWTVEAEWDTNGAYCLNDIRQQGWKAQGMYPECSNGRAKVRANCGSLKEHRARLVSMFEPVAQ